MQTDKTDTQSNQKPSRLADVRPRLIIIAVAVWVLVQMGRITAFSIVQSVIAGNDSAAWLYPALVDMFIGITAPFVAFALWRRRGLAVWVTALVWFTISIFDHLDGMTAALTTPVPVGLGGGSAPIAITGFLVFTVLDVVALVLLTRRKMKEHYLGIFSTYQTPQS